MAAAHLPEALSSVTLIILILGNMMVMLSNGQGAQAGQATIETMMTPNKLSPDLYTTQEGPPIAAARPQFQSLQDPMAQGLIFGQH